MMIFGFSKLLEPVGGPNLKDELRKAGTWAALK
jgi:hypothetical protein